MDKSKIKPSFDTNRQVLGKIFPLDTPFTVILDTSERCNFRCRYCFRASEDKSGYYYASRNDLMDMEVFKLAVEHMKAFPQQPRQISLSHQGEPLCNPNVPEMVRHIKKEGFTGRVSIHSNGSLLTEEYALRLAESDIDRVIFSIQGVSDEAYQRTCGVKADFDRLCRNIGILYKNKHNTQINVKVVDAALQEGEAEKFYEIFSPIADRVFVEQIVPIWEDKDYAGLTDTKLTDDTNKYGTEFGKVECCRICFDTIVVLPNGDVYPCTQIAMEQCLGNIKERAMVDLWNSSERKELMKAHLTDTRPGVCRDCYIPKNSVYTKEDWIDPYKEEILERLESK